MDKTWRHGQFVWREMMCPDVAKAKAFYGELLGWTFKDMPMGKFVYTIAENGGRGVGGLMPSTPEMGPPAWMSYVSVKDADEIVRVAKESGATLPMPIESAPGVGRFAVLNDPTGSWVGFLQGENPGDAPGTPSPGDFCWETLNTTDIEKAKAFYTKLFGWTASGGPGGNMTVFSAESNQVADVEPAQPGTPSHWLTHVVVPKLEAAREKAEKLGATIFVPVIDIPQVGRICIIQDPLGAVISLFEPGMPAS